MGGAIGGARANLNHRLYHRPIKKPPIFIGAGLPHPLSPRLVWRLLPTRIFETHGRPSKLFHIHTICDNYYKSPTFSQCRINLQYEERRPSLS